MTLLNVDGIGFSLDTAPVLKDITFSQRRLQRVAVVGETGSGKSTLLKVIAGLLTASEGEVTFEDTKVHTDRLVLGQPGIAYLSQHFELPKFLRVEQVLSYANTLSQEAASTLYEICQIDHLLARKTDQLSGGERQRIAMARLLITSPRLMLLDEPFTHLDGPHKNTLKDVINNLAKRLGITCILVSHDPHDTLPWAEKILVLQNGKLIQQGTPLKIYNQPVNEYAAGLFGKYNVLDTVFKPWIKLLPDMPRNKRLFLRPEHLELTDKKANAVAGVVARISYLGSHYEVDVKIEDVNLCVRCNDLNVGKGDRTGVTVSAERVWTLKNE